MDDAQQRKWKRRGLLLALGEFVRTWLPSIVLHALVLLCLTFVTIGSGVFGDEDGEETGVNIVMREADDDKDVEYLNKEEFEAQNSNAPALLPAEQPSEDLKLEQLQESPVEQNLESIIGPGSEDSGSTFGGGGGGGGGQTSFFGLSAKGKRVVYIVDRSGSMHGHPFLAAKSELMRSIKALPRGARYNVLFFSSGHTAFVAVSANRLMRSSRSYNRKVFEWVRQVPCEGGTEPLAALLSALAMEPDVIYFLTDGAFDAEVVPRVTRANKKNNVQIHCIGFSTSGRRLLKELSRLNGGDYRAVSPRRYNQERGK